MAVNLGSLLVSLGLDYAEFKSGLSQAEKQFRTTQRNFEAIGKKMSNIGRNLSIGVTAPLAALGVASFKAASDAAELESAFRQTFGSMSKEMEAWAVQTGDAMGRSTQEIEKGANAFGLFFNQAAPTKQAAADLSKTFTVLAQDLSSFFNVSPDEALQKLRSGLSGESEPLRDFGVFLDEGTVAQEALRMGLAKTTKELTDQDKILARANLILEKTKNAQGDVARTADGTANRIRAGAAAFEEMQVAIGNKLLPALTPLITSITNLLNAFNRLPQGVQTGIVGFLGFAAAVGPALALVGNLTKLLAPFIAGIKTAAEVATAAGASVTRLGLALNVVRAGLLTMAQTVLPVVAAIGALVAIYYLATRRTKDQTEAEKQLTKDHAANQAATDKLKQAVEALATAQGKARTAAIEEAKAQRENAIQKARSAVESLKLARAELARARAFQVAQNTASVGGGVPGTASFIQGTGDRRAASAEKIFKARVKEFNDLAAAIDEATKAINAPAPKIDVPTVNSTGAGSSSGNGSTGPTGPSRAEIEAQFIEDQRRLDMEILSAKARLATGIDDQGDLQYEMLALEREQRIAEVDANKDYSAKQKDALKKQIDELYGTAAALDEQGNLVVEQNKGLLAQQIRREQQFEIERQASDAAQQEFEHQRDLLSFQADLADTQEERKRIALEILALEQQYRRQQLEMILASQTATDAEKKRAKAILDSLATIEAGETASANRANETDVERYLRNLNKSPAQINEAIDQIKIDGLEALSNALVDAIVNFKSLADVAKSVVQTVLSELLKLAIQKAIIQPLANALFGGGGIPGFATGTDFAPGGLALVGEKGPELVNLRRGSQVIPNHELRGMMGGGATFNIYQQSTGNERMDRANSAMTARAIKQRLNG